jgi:hypothetical protein
MRNETLKAGDWLVLIVGILALSFMTTHNAKRKQNIVTDKEYRIYYDNNITNEFTTNDVGYNTWKINHEAKLKIKKLKEN